MCVAVAPSIEEVLLPNEINAEVGKEFKIVVPYKGGSIKSATVTLVCNYTRQFLFFLLLGFHFCLGI